MVRNKLSYLNKLGLIFAVLMLFACSTPTDSSSTTTASTSTTTIATGHTVSEKGVMHKTGLTNPLTNCVSCHGSDLKGGSAGVSCYSCHGQKW